MIERLRTMWASPEVRKITGNLGWLLSEKGLVMVVSLTVSVWVARYLGPDGYGALNYALAFVGLFGTFTYLGVSGIAVRDLIETPDDRDELLGTVFALKLAGAFVAIVCIATLAWFRVPDPQDRLLVGILSVGMVFQSVTVIAFWYQSRLESRYTVVASTVAAVSAAVVNVALVLSKASVVAFAVVVVSQQALNTAGLFWVYRRQGLSVRRWRVRRGRAVSLLRQSWPLLLSSVGSVIYLKIDQVMIGQYGGTADVGVYAVAVKFSEVWYFLPSALAASLFPKIVRLKQESIESYGDQMQRMYRIMVVGALAIALPTTVIAGPLLDTLYGAAYAGADSILRIHIWACPAIFMGAVLSKWLVSEGLLMFSFTRHGLGALVNIGLNMVLIPRYGGVGAATATVVSYTIAAYLSCFTDRRTRATGIMMTRALFTPWKNLLGSPT